MTDKNITEENSEKQISNNIEEVNESISQEHTDEKTQSDKPYIRHL